jgi:hypothetical protein
MDVACVDGWVDWNNDGDFDDPLEHILDGRMIYDSMVVNDIGFTNNETQGFEIPEGVLSGPGTKSFYARFRAAPFQDGCHLDLTPYGYVAGGEVEDYLWEFESECEKEDECVEFTLLDLEFIGDQVVFTWQITDNCEYGLSYVAFSLPEDVSAVDYPAVGGTYLSALTGHTYSVENPGTGWYVGPLPSGVVNPGGNPGRPFRAIKFEEMGGDGIKNGEVEIFIYTLNLEDYDPTLPIIIAVKGGTYSYDVVITPSMCIPQ